VRLLRLLRACAGASIIKSLSSHLLTKKVLQISNFLSSHWQALHALVRQCVLLSSTSNGPAPPVAPTCAPRSGAVGCARRRRASVPTRLRPADLRLRHATGRPCPADLQLRHVTRRPRNRPPERPVACIADRSRPGSRLRSRAAGRLRQLPTLLGWSRWLQSPLLLQFA
jgi:hypothetical protein